ncbi:MAG: STAS domain-containing protein [Gammaproteobacteria bacterium]|nr:STAS domain-containing protein [Gammaproteobacteria bacterium]
MLIEDRTEGDALVVRVLEPRLDARTAVGFKTKFEEYTDAGHRRIILNLAQTEFIDSSGLGAIVAAFKRVGRDGEFSLCGLQDATLSIFKLTRMDKVFTIFPTENEALAG